MSYKHVGTALQPSAKYSISKVKYTHLQETTVIPENSEGDHQCVTLCRSHSSVPQFVSSTCDLTFHIIFDFVILGGQFTQLLKNMVKFSQ